MEAKICLQKKLKSQKDYEMIEKFMLELHFVQKLKLQHGPLVVQDLCRNLSYIKHPANTEIITINREQRTFYVILSGRVSISIFVQTKLQRKKSFIRTSIDNSSEDALKLQEIKFLEQGESFGELSLLKDNSRATATIITKTDSEFAILTRQQYHDILGKISQTEYQHKYDFIKQISLFSNWLENDLRQVSYYIVQRTFVRNQIVIHEGGENTQAFLVKSGSFSILKKKSQNDDLFISQLAPLEVYYQRPEEPTYNFTIKCISNESILYEVSLYDLHKYMRNNNEAQFKNYSAERLEWRLKRFQELKKMEDNRQHTQKDTQECKDSLNETIKLFNDLKIRSVTEYHKAKPQETALQKTLKSAKRAIRKGILPRFQPKRQESIDSDTLPRIRNRSKKDSFEKININLVDVERSFQTIKNYQIGQAEKYNLYFVSGYNKIT
ncbi:hypothetical protein pb186bvf_004585 [Paramecium bursaria]